MKQIPILLFLALLFSFCGTDHQNEGDIYNTHVDEPDTTVYKAPATSYEANFTSEEGAFKCYFPDKKFPQEEINQVKSPDGNLNVHSYEYETDVLQFSVRWCDYPKGVLLKYSNQDILKNVIGGFFQNLDLKVIQQDSTEKFQGYPTLMTIGQSNNPEVNGSMYVYRKDFMVKKRLYQLGLIRLDHYPDSKDYEQFIYPFQIIKPE
jgi:hypothetical protein